MIGKKNQNVSKFRAKAKLSTSEAMDIQRMFEFGISIKGISRMFHVEPEYVAEIVARTQRFKITGVKRV